MGAGFTLTGRLGLRAERAWHAGAARWWLLCAGSAVGIIASSAAAFEWHRLTDRQAVVRQRIGAAREALELRRRSIGIDRTPPPRADFAQRLPDVADVQPVLATLQRAAATAGVVMVGVQLTRRAASSEQLARADMTVSMRGGYPQLKLALAEVLGHHPNATLAHWAMRRTAPAEPLEATVVIGIWAAPLPDPLAAVTPSAGSR